MGAHRAALSFACSDAATAALLAQVLAVEASEGPTGSTVLLSVLGSSVHADVQAKDLATFRAAVNSVVRLADTALRTLGVAPT